jgi:hypothetical protein
MLFTIFLASLISRASAAACTPAADNCPKLSDGLYCPVNDVTEHGDINRDVAQIKTYLSEDPVNYAAAKEVYTDGDHSSKGGGVMRTLQALAQKDMTGSSGAYTNPWYSGSLALAGSIDAIWHDHIMDCLDNTGDCNGKSDSFRTYIINKCCIGIVMGYTTYEMGAAVWKAADGSLTDAGAAYAWDEAAAFFVGNIEPALGDGVTGSAPGNLYSPYEFAWKRDTDFPSGFQVHTKSLPVFNYGLKNIRDGNYNANNLAAAQTAIYKMIAITAIRSAVKYSYKAAKGGSSNGFSDKYLAEGWAYWRVGSGYLAGLNAAAKAKVDEIDTLFDLSQTTLPASMPCDVKTKVEALYAHAGLSCALVGDWKDASQAGCPACSSSASGTIISGDSTYVNMCKSGSASAAVMSSLPKAAATTFAAAVAATCDFA